MNNNIFFDHIEVHVNNISAYCDFLQRLFKGGRFKKISDSGTSMFKSNDGVNIEIKKADKGTEITAAGFCNPCIRMENGREHIENTLGLKIDKTIKNPDGNCYFFKDREGIMWHLKEYSKLDEYVNW